MNRTLAFLLPILVFLTGCGASGEDGNGPAGEAPLVLAASSMQEAMTEAADAWASEGYEKPVVSFAATSALARQIESGVDADLFVAADQDWMDTVEASGRIRPASRRNVAANALVLVAPPGGPDAVALTRDGVLAALGDGRIAMADPAAVPAGKYGKAAFESLGFWSDIAPRVAQGENVRAALALVERGAAPLGVVYATDAMASKSVGRVATFPAESYPPIIYPMALLSGADGEAQAFADFLSSPRGQQIFARYGFVAPPR